MEAKAIGRYIRLSPRKTRLVADTIRGLSIGKAEAQLHVINKAASKPILKLLKSALDAARGKKMAEEKLYVKTIMVDGGPSLKRFRPRAFGRGAPIRKRTSHITVIVSEKNK